MTCFKPRWAPWGAPVYAVLEGMAVGGISLVYEKMYHGIVPQAAALTLGVGLGLGLLYQSRVIRVSDIFVRWVTMATFGVVLYYLVVLGCSFFGVPAPMMTGSGWLSIGLNLLICGIAAANYLVDFRIIETDVVAGLPKWAEWSGAFGVLITTVSVRYNKARGTSGQVGLLLAPV